MTDSSQYKSSSPFTGFYQRTVAERVEILRKWSTLSAEETDQLQRSLAVAQADKMVENVIGVFTFPLGLGVNFFINEREYVVPMAIEEPSVIAAASAGAKVVRRNGGFLAGSSAPVMSAQIQLLDVDDVDIAMQSIREQKSMLLEVANTSRTIASLGGGPLDLRVRSFRQTVTGPMVIVDLLFDVRDAMGANALNTAAETLAPALERLTQGRALLRILSNLSDRRTAWAEARIAFATLDADAETGRRIAEALVEANAFALVDPYRATTHNKGVMNGIDAVVMATGNDWRAVEAGAHAYAARSGQYRALTEWQLHSEANGGSYLRGRLELPMAIGTVGGATKVHPTAQLALKILGVRSARELAEVVTAVGLAQNLAALRALVTDGIQRGHMTLHARQVAMAAGAVGEEIDRIADALVRAGQVRVAHARKLLEGKR